MRATCTAVLLLVVCFAAAAVSAAPRPFRGTLFAASWNVYEKPHYDNRVGSLDVHSSGNFTQPWLADFVAADDATTAAAMSEHSLLLYAEPTMSRVGSMYVLNVTQSQNELRVVHRVTPAKKLDDVRCAQSVGEDLAMQECYGLFQGPQGTTDQNAFMRLDVRTGAVSTVMSLADWDGWEMDASAFDAQRRLFHVALARSIRMKENDAEESEFPPAVDIHLVTIDLATASIVGDVGMGRQFAGPMCVDERLGLVTLGSELGYTLALVDWKTGAQTSLYPDKIGYPTPYAAACESGFLAASYIDAVHHTNKLVVFDLSTASATSPAAITSVVDSSIDTHAYALTKSP